VEGCDLGSWRGVFGFGAVADRSDKLGRDVLERLFWLVEAW